jgi:hypothetical protein
VRCAGQTISDIIIRTEPPAIAGISKRSRMVARTLLSMHATTRPEVVRRLVVFDKGQPCDELRRAESERILRAQRYLAEASIIAYDDGNGGVILEVLTVDELSTIVDVGATATSPYVRRLKFGSSNVGGQAVLLEAQWQHSNGPYRDGYGGRFVDYQFAGRPYELSLSGIRRALGYEYTGIASHAFLTDLQRVAWRMAAGRRAEYVPFLRAEVDAPTSYVERRFVDVGGIVRLGEPGRLSLFGASFTQEQDDPANSYILITNHGLVPDTSQLRRTYREYRSARLNALWGVRNIRFMRVTGFDALTATQDVRVGFQLGSLFGRSLAVLGSENDDIFVSSDVYGGVGSPQTFAAFQLQGEGRQSYDDNAWDGILGSGRAAAYHRATPRQTLVADAEWSGGWRQRVPFQLTLSDARGGVRGFSRSHTAGARRVVTRVEDRWFVGRFRGAADVGLAPFFDAGRLWAGDAPFGVDTRVVYGAGIALLASVPPRSKRLYRLEVGFPITHDPHSRWQVRLSTSDLTRLFWDEPQDVRRSRESTVPASIFNWP